MTSLNNTYVVIETTARFCCAVTAAPLPANSLLHINGIHTKTLLFAVLNFGKEVI